MAKYTVQNLKKIEDQAPKFDLSPQLEFRSGREPLELENLGISYLRVGPNFRIPFGHKHKEQEEVYVIVSGSARIKLDDEVVDLKPWDAVRMHRDAVRNVEAGPDGAEIVAIGAPNTAPGDAEMQPGWWSD
jgi:mannose-6-phosphate isomerase-like protein (cupin superfamily)